LPPVAVVTFCSEPFDCPKEIRLPVLSETASSFALLPFDQSRLISPLMPEILRILPFGLRLMVTSNPAGAYNLA